MKKSEKIKYYYDNPCYCLSCGKIIEYDGVQPLHKALERNIALGHVRIKTQKEKLIVVVFIVFIILKIINDILGNLDICVTGFLSTSRS
nr:MAG TPA: hypothetical protein [Caudoviricetes sp.]